MKYIGKKGGIGIVASERNNFSWQFIQSLLDLKSKMGSDVMIIHVQVGNIAEARNKVLEVARQQHLDWVLMLDSDIVYEKNSVIKLIDTMERQEASIGAGLYFSTFPPFNCTASTTLGDKYSPVTEFEAVRYIDACGMGFTLITKELFDLPFEWENSHGEDYIFCEKARERGCKIILDPNISCGHLRMIPVDRNLIEKIK